MENIKGILVSAVVPMSNHIANGGEKLLGNASSIKRTPNGKVYISGQMQRHALFSTMAKINEDDANHGKTYVSNGDGISNFVEKDLRADMGGFMHPSKGSYSGRRTSPLSVTPAVAMESSNVGRDLMVRFKMNQTSERDQALATREFSEKDYMLMNFHLDISSLSISKVFEYEGEFHIRTDYIKHCTEEERQRRVRLFMESCRSISDYANQARNAVAGDPQKVLIVFDQKLNRKASRFFEASDMEQKNIIDELESRNAEVFIGDDQTESNVFRAFDSALESLNKSTLYDPCNGDESIRTFLEAFPEN